MFNLELNLAVISVFIGEQAHFRDISKQAE